MKSLINKYYYNSYDLYDSFKVDEILKDNELQNIDEILKYAYESQRGNQLLLITFCFEKNCRKRFYG